LTRFDLLRESDILHGFAAMEANQSEPPGGAARRTLESWSEIAGYLRRSVSTVQRWEREKGLPVYRHTHRSQGTVYAYADEIDEWRARVSNSPRKGVVLEQRSKSDEESVAAAAAPGSPPARRSWIVAGTLLSLGSVFAGVLAISERKRGADVTKPQVRSYLLESAPEAADSPNLSPDGTLVAYTRTIGGVSRIYIRPAAGGDARLLLPGDSDGQEMWPIWSRDGQWIAFGKAGSGGVSVHIATKHEGQSTTVLRLADPDLVRTKDLPWATWMPDDQGLIVSDRSSPDQPAALYAVSKDGRSRRRLTDPPPGYDGDVQGLVSPDGEHLAFVRRQGFEWDLWVAPWKGGPPRQVTFDRKRIAGIAWMPDSRSLVFSSDRDSAVHSLWQVVLDGTDQPVRLAGPVDESVWPSVARLASGGYRVAYQAVRHSVNLHRLKLNAGAQAQPEPICPSTRFDWHSQLSPDGKRVAFSSNRSGFSNIWICEAGSEDKQVTQFSGSYTDSPRWSPSGDWLLFTSRLGDSREVFSVDLRTGELQPVTRDPADDGRASYSRDGLSIYFRSNRSGRNQIWRMPAAGGEPVQITRTGAMEGFESPDGKLFYFTKDRPQLGVWSVPVNGGKETKVVDGPRDTRWAVAQDGIYWVTHQAPFRVHRYSFVAQRTEVLATLPDKVNIWAGFSVSWDGRVAVWPQTVLDSSDIGILDVRE
jgi:Tol biopolymer transport system component